MCSIYADHMWLCSRKSYFLCHAYQSGAQNMSLPMSRLFRWLGNYLYFILSSSSNCINHQPLFRIRSWNYRKYKDYVYDIYKMKSHTKFSWFTTEVYQSYQHWLHAYLHIDRLVQERHNFIANALELRLLVLTHRYVLWEKCTLWEECYICRYFLCYRLCKISAWGEESPSHHRWLFNFNSLWPSDTIWRQRSGSTLAQVMACCLTAPSHYLNQCWLIIS